MRIDFPANVKTLMLQTFLSFLVPVLESFIVYFIVQKLVQ